MSKPALAQPYHAWYNSEVYNWRDEAPVVGTGAKAFMYTFQKAAGNGASGWADDGRGKLALLPGQTANVLHAQSPRFGANTALEEHLVSTIRSCYDHLSGALIREYYKALTSSPIVFLVSTDVQAGAALARGFAEALVGPGSPQLAVISGAKWHRATGEDRHYYTVQQRFSAIRCQELAQEAVEPCNEGKAYFACFESLSARELEAHVEAFGTQPQVSLSAVIMPNERAVVAARFPHATFVEIYATVAVPKQEMIPPPVGFQRLWLQARSHVLAPQSGLELDLARRAAEHHWLARAQWRSVLMSRGL